MERRFQKKKSTANFINNNFYLEEFTQIESKKQNNGRAYETKIKDKEHHFDCCFEFDTNAKSRFVRLFFNRLSEFKRLPLVYFYKKPKTKQKCIFR